tara:strand:- start:253 stop:912 length:660 start_codon:yes stop_codon:yes gene_type:complete
MKKISKTLKIFLIALISIFSANQSMAQVDIGADFMSRYVWRGGAYSNGPSIQPYMSYATGGEEDDFGFEVGFWGAYANDSLADELDLYASLSYGPVAVTITNYIFPDITTGGTTKYFDSGIWEGILGLELGPVSLTGGYFFEDGDTYIAGSVPLSEEVGFTLGLGDGFYTDSGDFELIEVAVSYGKEIKITEDFSLPMSGNLIYNPSADQMYLVFGFSL